MPLQLAAAREQRLAEVDRLDEPLAAGDDLERPIALLVELDRVRDRPRLADEIARRLQLLDDLARAPSRRTSRPARRSAAARAPASIDSHPACPTCTRPQRAVGLNHRPHRQAQLAPPGHVGDVAERADHRDAAALRRVGQRMRPDRHAHAEERRHDLLAEQRLVALVVGMRDERHAGRNQLGPRRFDLDAAARWPIQRASANRMRWYAPGELAILELGLRHGGPEVDVPERRRLDLVRQAALEQPQERDLRHALRPPADRRVGHRPVDRQPEVLPEVLEGLLVFGRQPVAELDEVRARDRDRRLGRRVRRRRTPESYGSDGSHRTP